MSDEYKKPVFNRKSIGAGVAIAIGLLLFIGAVVWALIRALS